MNTEARAGRGTYSRLAVSVLAALVLGAAPIASWSGPWDTLFVLIFVFLYGLPVLAALVGLYFATIAAAVFFLWERQARRAA